MSKHATMCLFCMLTVFTTHGRAALIHVNNLTGDDRSNGLFAQPGAIGDGPVGTIGRAFQIARGTDAIVVANTGVAYSESITLDRPDLAGSAAYPLIIEGNGAVLRGLRSLPADFWTRVGEGTYRYQPYRKGHYQLAVRDATVREARATLDATAPPTLEPMQWTAIRGFVYFRVEPLKFIDQYEIEAPLFDIGIGLHNARHVVVRNFNVEGYRLDGVAVTGNSRGIRLVNIRSTGNGRAGLSVGGTSQVRAHGLDLAGNRIADRLVLMKGQLVAD